jgi:hypothetical protein
MRHNKVHALTSTFLASLALLSSGSSNAADRLRLIKQALELLIIAFIPEAALRFLPPATATTETRSINYDGQDRQHGITKTLRTK